VKQAGLQRLPPAQVEVASCRAKGLAQRRGRSAARAERWSAVGQQAEPRWCWQASAQHRGTAVAEVFGRRQNAGLLPWHELWAPLHLPRVSPEGLGRGRASYCSRAAHAGPSPAPAERPPAQQCAPAAHASEASHALFVQTDHEAPSGSGPLQQARRICRRPLTRNQQI
jgi:IS1 transposase